VYLIDQLRVVDELQGLKLTLLILRPKIREDLGRPARTGLLDGPLIGHYLHARVGVKP
jgi:hypothetical protein